MWCKVKVWVEYRFRYRNRVLLSSWKFFLCIYMCFVCLLRSVLAVYMRLPSNLENPPASVSQVPRLQLCATVKGPDSHILSLSAPTLFLLAVSGSLS